jgi:site-specific recombinase XerD
MPKLTVVKPKTPPPLAREVEDYVSSVRAQHPSGKTANQYGFALRQVFLPWCADNGITEPSQITTAAINRFNLHLQEHGGKEGTPLTRSSVWTYMKSVKRLVAWLTEQGEPVTATVKLPKLERRVIDVLSPREVDRLENAADSERDKLIIKLLFETGIRRAELTALRVHDVLAKADRTELRIHGKGSRQRLVGLTPMTARRLRKLLNGRPATDHVFIARRAMHEGEERQPLTDSGINQMMTGVARAAGFDASRKVTPHLLRHSAATHWLRSGMDSLYVARLLGHADLQMLNSVYAHLNIDDAHAALMKVLTGTRDSQ